MAREITFTAAELAAFLGKSFTAGALGIPGAVSGLTPLATQPAMPNTPEALRKVSKKAVNYRPATGSQRCDACVMWRPGRCTLVRGDIEPDATCDRWYARDASKGVTEQERFAQRVMDRLHMLEEADRLDKATGPHVAGLMVRAADTGRVLMLQRSIVEDDPAAGKLEPPGGHAEPGESLTQAAAREWQEETGLLLPQGALTGSWTSADGIYRGFVYEVPSEDVLDLEDGRDQVVNPDGDTFEAVLWLDPDLFAGNPMMRPEMERDLPAVLAALRGGSAEKSAETPMLSTTHNPLGPHSLWHTPDRHVSKPQALPDYVEGVAHGLERAGHPESEAIALAIAAIKEWAEGHAFGGKVKVTPTVQAAAQRALAEWEKLKESHHA